MPSPSLSSSSRSTKPTVAAQPSQVTVDKASKSVADVSEPSNTETIQRIATWIQKGDTGSSSLSLASNCMLALTGGKPDPTSRGPGGASSYRLCLNMITSCAIPPETLDDVLKQSGPAWEPFRSNYKTLSFLNAIEGKDGEDAFRVFVDSIDQVREISHRSMEKEQEFSKLSRVIAATSSITIDSLMNKPDAGYNIGDLIMKFDLDSSNGHDRVYRTMLDALLKHETTSPEKMAAVIKSTITRCFETSPKRGARVLIDIGALSLLNRNNTKERREHHKSINMAILSSIDSNVREFIVGVEGYRHTSRDLLDKFLEEIVMSIPMSPKSNKDSSDRKYMQEAEALRKKIMKNASHIKGW